MLQSFFFEPNTGKHFAIKNISACGKVFTPLCLFYKNTMPSEQGRLQHTCFATSKRI